MSDLNNLVDMGFDKEKATLALKKSGNLTSAIDWLDKNAEKSLSDLQAEDAAADAADDKANDNPALEAGEVARSMVCNDCGKKFRGMSQAQFHAEKSGHDDFAESAEELAPLTEEEKAAKLQAMRALLSESDDVKEELRKQEQIKEAKAKRQEKLDDAAAKQRIKDKIAADKLARKQKADEEKAMRANPDAYNPGAPVAAAAAAAPAKVSANHAEARLRLQTASGNVMKTFPAETTLFEVAHAIAEENGVQATSFTQNFPKKSWESTDFGMTLKEAGLVPSAALIVK
jgi:hypothetical protein